MEPISVSPELLTHWSARRPLLLKCAAAWAKYSPRAKGAVPRWVGRSFGRQWRTTIATRSGSLLAVCPNHLDVYTTILSQGAWEPEVVAACLQAVDEGDTFLDVGANAGYITMEVASRRSSCETFAFEPQYDLARLVAISAALSGLSNVTVFPIALGEENGETDLFVPAHAVHASLAPAEGAEQVRCVRRTIDSMVHERLLPRPNVIKIDVEGAEWGVLRGARETLASAGPILIFELTSHTIRFGYDPDDLIGWLRSVYPYNFYKLGQFDVLAVPDCKTHLFADLHDPL